ncbi:hypothetical protein AMATHDRAFT_69608 [Amanita thiersii Skay4041]|uniref:Transcription regulator Rua1 C-terminal domain-containing protein n=1 Tax=Amanita thiersii Skay4041 TaxID=703135 RepID=A0A2A9NFX0_9AGAR|nr:hypothetical protein AMATHDRAFT_69608 [Amanita thiersii Skay4041]
MDFLLTPDEFHDATNLTHSTVDMLDPILNRTLFCQPRHVGLDEPDIKCFSFNQDHALAHFSSPRETLPMQDILNRSNYLPVVPSTPTPVFTRIDALDIINSTALPLLNSYATLSKDNDVMLSSGSVPSVFSSNSSQSTTPYIDTHSFSSSTVTLLGSPLLSKSLDAPCIPTTFVQRDSPGAMVRRLSPISQFSESSFALMKDMQDSPFNSIRGFSSPWASPDADLSPIIRASPTSYSSDSSQEISPSRTVNNKALLKSFPVSIDPQGGSTPPRSSRALLGSPFDLSKQPAATKKSDNETSVFDDDSSMASPSMTLSPLTPLASSSPVPAKFASRRRSLFKKRQLDTDTPSPSSLPPRKRRCISRSYSQSTDSDSESQSEPTSDAENAFEVPLEPFYTNRTFHSIEISPDFPLFYRRYPLSSYLQLPGTESPCSLFGVKHPGGTYNPPRTPFDLYTPRFVKGKGTEKVGLCPLCIESPSRGGEGKAVWLAMKFSAFNYHMQYSHGISASTGLPFSPPTEFRVTTRQNPGKKEKTTIRQGYCHKCLKWVPIEGVKDMETKVKEIYWWKHAASCHHDSGAGRDDVYEKDYVYQKLVSLRK